MSLEVTKARQQRKKFFHNALIYVSIASQSELIMHFNREELVASIVGRHRETTEKSYVCASESKSTTNRAVEWM